MTEVKKRGRKKKTENIIHSEKISHEVKTPSKRGRKAKVVDFKKNLNINMNDSVDIEDTYILHLPITLDKLINIIPKQSGIENILMAQPIIPKASNSNINNSYHTNKIKVIDKINSTLKENTDIPDLYNSTNDNGTPEIIHVYNKTPLPVKLDHENVKRVEIDKTDVACWWCCHQFDTYPVCTPLKYNAKKDIFNVVGVFCSFNCAKTYSLKETNGTYHSYDTLLYKRVMGSFKSIKLAPPRTVLKMFGGPITIEEYRSTFDTLSTIKINKFPMVFIPTQVEYHKMVNNTVKSKINRSSELSKKQITDASKRLSVSKNNNKETHNTLMSIMGIKVKD